MAPEIATPRTSKPDRSASLVRSMRALRNDDRTDRRVLGKTSGCRSRSSTSSSQRPGQEGGQDRRHSQARGCISAPTKGGAHGRNHRKVSIIVSKGSLEGVYPALIMANGAGPRGSRPALLHLLRPGRHPQDRPNTSRWRLSATPGCTWRPRRWIPRRLHRADPLLGAARWRTSTSPPPRSSSR